MGWLQRIFGHDKPANAEVNPAPAPADQQPADAPAEIPAERLGLTGEYDQSGLAKRVALAFDQDDALADIDGLWVAQLGTTVVLKGSVPSQDILNKMIEVANNVNGASAVTTDQVTVS